jgi:hypothetical protein
VIYLLLILVAGIVLFTVVTSTTKHPSSKPGRARGSVDRSEIQHRWESIHTVASSGASGLRNSIMEADKLLDYVMKKLGYPGETMAERLKVAQRELSNRDGVWRAHKLRNAMAHEVGFDLVSSQANEALREFEQALKDLKAL